MTVSSIAGHPLVWGWDERIRALMEDPGGRLLLAFSFFAFALLAVLLIVIPLLTRSIRRTFRRLTQGVDDIRRYGPARQLSPDIGGNAGALIDNLNRLLDELRGRMASLEAERDSIKKVLDAPTEYGLLTVSAIQRIHYINPGACRQLGYGEEEILDRSLEVLFPEQDWPGFLSRLSSKTPPGGSRAHRVRLQRKDRTLIPFQMTVTELEPEGERGGFVLTFHEVQRTLELEHQLKELESRYRALVEGLGEGVVVLQGGRIAYANPQAGQLLGIPGAAARGRHFKDLVSAQDLLPTLAALESINTSRSRAELDVRLQSGEDRPALEVRLSLAAIEREGEKAVLVTLRDQTQTRRAERELKSSQKLLDATVDSSLDGVVVVDERGGRRGVILVNRRAAELLGRSADQLLGLTEEEFQWEIGNLCPEPEWAQAFQDQETSPQEGIPVLELNSPGHRTLELWVGPLVWSGRTQAGRIYGLRDVTEYRRAVRELREQHRALDESRSIEKKTLDELREAREALAKRNEELEKSNQDLSSVDEMRTNLLTNVSHELQTPLVLIKGYTEMILKRKIGPITPEQEKGLNVALRNIDRLVEMIDNLLDFSRMERGDASLQLEEFPLWQLIDEVLELVREKAGKKQVRLSTEFETESSMVRADRSKISQVFINLLSNAIKFNREGGEVHVRVGPDERMLRVTIRDTGMGIPAAEQDRIFERFYQVDSSSRTRHEGTGIGLAIVREILKLHGCDIEVESTEGEGSAFSFTLPRGASPVSSPETGRLGASSARASRKGSG